MNENTVSLSFVSSDALRYSQCLIQLVLYGQQFTIQSGHFIVGVQLQLFFLLLHQEEITLCFRANFIGLKKVFSSDVISEQFPVINL